MDDIEKSLKIEWIEDQMKQAENEEDSIEYFKLKKEFDTL